MSAIAKITTVTGIAFTAVVGQWYAKVNGTACWKIDADGSAIYRNKRGETSYATENQVFKLIETNFTAKLGTTNRTASTATAFRVTVEDIDTAEFDAEREETENIDA